MHLMATPSYETVTAMIAPALFVTVTGSLIISTATRMGRIVERGAPCASTGEEPRQNR